AATWTKPRRVIAKVEWHPGELYPRVGFIVTNMSRPAERVVAFYNKRGTCEQWIKEGKGAIKWTRLSCRTFVANTVRLQLHALAYNLANFLRTLATPEPIKDWSMTTLKERLIKTGAKVVSHGRYVAMTANDGARRGDGPCRHPSTMRGCLPKVPDRCSIGLEEGAIRRMQRIPWDRSAELPAHFEICREIAPAFKDFPSVGSPKVF